MSFLPHLPQNPGIHTAYCTLHTTLQAQEKCQGTWASPGLAGLHCTTLAWPDLTDSPEAGMGIGHIPLPPDERRSASSLAALLAGRVMLYASRFTLYEVTYASSLRSLSLCLLSDLSSPSF